MARNSRQLPAYGGWVLIGIAVSYFGAAVNTMAGWLYVVSGISFALLAVSAVFIQRSLASLVINRRGIQPITVGDELKIELAIHNPRQKAASLLKITDILPFVLGKPISRSIELIPGQDTYLWIYYYPTRRQRRVSVGAAENYLARLLGAYFFVGDSISVQLELQSIPKSCNLTSVLW